MGCGYSRPTPRGEMQASQGVGIMLRRQIVDIRKVKELGKIKGGDDTLSKKQLLKDGADDEHEHSSRLSDIHEIDRSSISSPDDSVQGAAPLQPLQSPRPAPLEAPKAQQIPQSISLQESDKIIVERKKEVAEDTEEEDDEDEDGRLSNYDNEFPRSPSFRVYYIESMADKHDDIDDSTDNGTECIDHSQSEVTAKSCVIDENSNEESTTNVKKKGKKVKRLGKARHGGKSGSVKNLFNVKSCYSTSCSGHNHKCLVDGKTG